MNPDHIYEKRFILTNETHWRMALDYVGSLKHMVKAVEVYEVTVKPYKKTRSIGQNSRYWASLNELMEQKRAYIQSVADSTGHTPLEVKRLIAVNMPPEHVAILFTHSAEVAHDIVKEICDVPTSTRLGTKEFMQFEERMIQAIIEIMDEIKSISNAA